VIFPFPGFHHFQPLHPLLLSFLICPWRSQYDLHADLKPGTHSVLIYLVFSLYCLWQHICIVSFIKSIISGNVSLLLVNHEDSLRLCVMMHLLSLLHFVHCQRCLLMTLSVFKRHMWLPHLFIYIRICWQSINPKKVKEPLGYRINQK
jgi:hypothetical protein